MSGPGVRAIEALARRQRTIVVEATPEDKGCPNCGSRLEWRERIRPVFRGADERNEIFHRLECVHCDKPANECRIYTGGRGP